MQCDFDTIGTQSVVADIETALVIHDLLLAIGFDDFTIHVNNRRVLTGLLERLGLADRSTLVLRALDKLGKIGPEKVAEEMVAVAGATREQAADVLRMAQLSGSSDSILSGLERLVGPSEAGQQGIARLAELLRACTAAGVPERRLKLDVAIARGLDYYTGTIFETFLDRLPAIGSVCSGGRYDNLAALYTHQQLPGIGASLGLDRLLAAMEELGLLERVSTPAPVFMPYFVEDRLHDYLRLAAALRSAGLGVEVFPESKRLGQQLKYADRRGFRVAVIAGEDEWSAGTCQIKDLASGTSRTVPLGDSPQSLIAALHEMLGEKR
jgi:histidyl-tRNA synthetase